MANINDTTTLGNVDLIYVDADPSAGVGTPAFTPSIAFALINSIGTLWLKTGAADTAWSPLTTQSNVSTLSGFTPRWLTGTSISLDAGKATDSTGVTLMVAPNTLNLVTSVVGPNALDAGTVAANTWYYIWIICKADGTTAGLISTSRTAPTLPNTYIYKRLLPFAMRTTGSIGIYNFSVTGGWPEQPTIYYNTQYDATTSNNIPWIFNGTAANNTWVIAACSAFIPPVSSAGFFYVQALGQIKLRRNGVTDNGKTIGGTGDGGTFSGTPKFNQSNIPIGLDLSQNIQYAGASGAVPAFIAVEGFIVDGII